MLFVGAKTRLKAFQFRESVHHYRTIQNHSVAAACALRSNACGSKVQNPASAYPALAHGATFGVALPALCPSLRSGAPIRIAGTCGPGSNSKRRSSCLSYCLLPIAYCPFANLLLLIAYCFLERQLTFV